MKRQKGSKKTIVVAAENIFSLTFVKVLEAFLPDRIITFIPFSEVSGRIKALEKRDNLIITIVMSESDKESIDRLQAKMEFMPPFLHCCLIKNATFMHGNILPIPIDLQDLLKKITDQPESFVQTTSKRPTIEHNLEKLMCAVSTFKHNSANRIGVFKSYIGGDESADNINDALNSFYHCPLSTNNIADNLMDDFINCRKEFSAFGLQLDDLDPGIEKRIAITLHNIKEFPKAFKEGEKIPKMIKEHMDSLINILIELQEKLKRVDQKGDGERNG